MLVTSLSDPVPDKRYLREEGSALAHSWKSYSLSWWAGTAAGGNKAAGDTTVASGSRERQSSAQLCIVLLIQSWTSPWDGDALIDTPKDQAGDED